MSVLVWVMVAIAFCIAGALWAIPGSIGALVASYVCGARKDRGDGIVRP